MNLHVRLARNSLWLLIARVGTQGSMVIVTYVLARRLGVVGFGEYAFIASAIVIGHTLTSFGSDMYLIREIASGSDFSKLPSVLFLQLALSCLFIGFILLFIQYLPNQSADSNAALKIYSFALIPLAFFTVTTSALRGSQKMISYAWLSLVIPILQVVSISIFIQRGSSVVMLAYLLLIIQTVGAMFGVIFCSTIFPRFWMDLRFSLNGIIHIFIACLPIAMIAILGVIYQKLNFAMLSFFGNASMVGIFSAAARVLEAARMGHFAVFTALYPAMANIRSGKDPVKDFSSSWFLLLVMAVIGSVLIFFLAKPVVIIFFGTDYQLSIPVLKILAFTLIPYTINTFLTLAFLAKKKETIVVLILLASLIILLLLNLSLIPFAGQIGAGWAFLFSEIAQALLFITMWIIDLFRKTDADHSKGELNELSDLPG
ncbi:MAG: oligosaccharide flippase family protein [Chloroflexi bacterium]|nr:oligosaccharide flippase family protein [Chloroflexota bacterium]